MDQNQVHVFVGIREKKTTYKTRSFLQDYGIFVEEISYSCASHLKQLDFH
jgi:hypothetical protein